MLNEIRKKKRARDACESAAREVARELDARLGPLRAALCSAMAELRAIFAALLGEDSFLNRRDKARVRRAYGHLLPDLEERVGGPDAEPHTPHGAREARPPRQAEAGYSAPKPKDQGPCLLRSLFRRLAVALHPDKVQDAEQRASLTAVMKEVTRAYELGDVARLVELERSWLAAPSRCEPEQDLVRNTELMVQANQELRRQLRELNAELKSLRDSVAAAAGAPRGGRSRNGEHSQDWLLSELERELSEVQTLRDFARGFLTGEVSLSEFLLGPAYGFDDPLERSEQFLSDAFGDEWPCRGARRSRRPRS